MPRRAPSDIGREAEDAALAWLQRRGLTLVARNWRWRGGEIDLILREGEWLVFVEVRCRRPNAFADGAASIDRRKQRRLRQGAALFLARHGDCPARFDVVALTPNRDGYRIEWIRNAIEGED